MKVYRIDEILERLDFCIENDMPFSHIRFGDGGLKYMAAVLRGDLKSLWEILIKEGMPEDRSVEILELWAYYARHADFVDTAQVYIDGYFWPRIKSENKKISKSTSKKLIKWKDYYSRCEIDVDKYCNPESNYLMTIRFNKNKKNILDIMKDRKVCIITAKPGIKETLKTFGYNVDIVQIVSQYENQYKNSFKDVVLKIREKANKYDLWLTAAGELGRVYSGLIKECGGRTIDIGFVIEFWQGENLHPRLEVFMKRNPENFLETKLTKKGKMFVRYI